MWILISLLHYKPADNSVIPNQADLQLHFFFKNGMNFIGLDKLFFQRKIVNIFLPITLSICFACSKEPSYEMVLLSTHNICFD